ncbi:hypothetical protein [Mucilaginibacter lacusdianchii]|uniref:hypothetical protein n=1 Tax=Mucilaginibacter lacusdianchii TaxID=2684211 RepID=UPI00131A79B3|nr:hypothetical protein [Mucilaginibacter sp. JXJ CY 39]
MTLYEFNALNENERAEVLWEQTPLSQRFEQPSCVILLYSLQDFYAEVFYDQEENRITRVRGFRALHLLAPYLP